MSSVRMPMQPEDNQIEAAIAYLPDMSPAKARRTLRQIYETFIDMRPEVALPPKLTKLQAQLLETLVEYEEEHGCAPTQRELADMFGIDRAAIRHRLQALKRKGYIGLYSKWRGIIIYKK